MFKIIDANGTIFSGNEDDIRITFRIITEEVKTCLCCGARDEIEGEFEGTNCFNCGSNENELQSNPDMIRWDGDLELIEVHSVYR